MFNQALNPSGELISVNGIKHISTPKTDAKSILSAIGSNLRLNKEQSQPEKV